MKIGVIGETRMPVLPYGPGGLGRTTHMIATELLRRGHDVTLHATECEFEGKTAGRELNPYLYEVVLDMTHEHALSQAFKLEPIVNLILDRECPYIPPRAVVETEYMQKHYPGARLAPAGIDTNAIPFTQSPGNYLVFMGLRVAHKQPEVAEEVAKRAGLPIHFICPPNDLTELQKWELLGGLALIAPYTIDAGPRSPLEAAACGTPTVCLDGDGTQEHVEKGLTGFVCADVEEMVEGSFKAVEELKRKDIRKWVRKNHDIRRTIDAHIKNLEEAAGGVKW